MASFRDTRAMVDGAFMAGITAVLGLIGMYIPPLFTVISIILPLPLAVLVRRRDLKVGIMALIVTGLLMIVLYPDPMLVLVMFIQFGPLGLVLGLLFKNYVSPGHALLTASLVSAVAALIVIILSVAVTGLSLELIQTSLYKLLDEVFTMYKETGYPVPPEQQEMMRASVKTSVLLLPATYCIYVVGSTVLTYLAGGKVLRRLNYNVNALPPFRQWRLPWYSIWGIIIGLIFLMLGKQLQLNILQTIGQNFLVVFLFTFFIFGLSVVAHFYKAITLPRPFKVMILVLMILYSTMMYPAIIILGVFDTIFNLRRPKIRKQRQ